MNKAAIFTGLGGFALGCLTIFCYQQTAAPPTTSGVAVTAVPAAKLVPTVVPPQPNPPTPAPSSVEPTVSISSTTQGLDTPEQKELLAKVGQTMKQQSEKNLKLRVDERLAALKSRLNLNDAQLAQYRPLVERMLQDASHSIIGEDGGISINLGNLNENQKSAAADKTQAEQELQSALTPEQLAAYQAWKQEEKANRVEVKANQELASLQSQLSLSPEQKDAAFASFSKLASEQGEQADLLSNPLGFMEQRKARVEAMRPILTPEQMAVYERSAGSNVMSFSLGDAGGATGVMSSIVLDGSAVEVVAPTTPTTPPSAK